MGKNEIRLRREMMSAGRIARHRNYDKLMERHHRYQKVKRITQVLTYILLAVILLLVIAIAFKWDKLTKAKTSPVPKHQSSVVHQNTAPESF